MTTGAWVVGSSGLLGRAVTRTLRARPDTVVIATSLSWSDPDRFNAQVSAALHDLLRHSTWSIFWCAGAGVVGTGKAELDAELTQFSRFLALLEERFEGGANPANGGFFYASSAGGVYAGSTAPPFTEMTVPVPLSPYGVAKLAAEGRLTEFATRTGMPALIGRISNLYGPDQRLHKAQGLISQLSKSSLGGAPTSIYVSLDTLRDYITADDCAGLIIDGVARLHSHEQRSAGTVVKILASQQPTTIASILGILRAQFKRRPNAMIGSSPHSLLQVRDLRLASVVWTELDQRTLTPLPVGIGAVINGMIIARGSAQAPESTKESR